MTPTMIALASLTGLTGLTPLTLVLLLVATAYLLFRHRVMPFGLSFETNDDLLKYLISIGFLDSAGGLKFRIKIKTADYTIVTGTDASGTLFTNRADAGAIVFTLPAASQAIKGVYYDFLGVADYDLTVAAATADTLLTKNDIAADSIAMSTSGEKIGGYMRFICDGTQWCGFGMSVGHTFTVATA